MNKRKNLKKLNLLYAEDDSEDQMLMKEALEEAKLANEVQIVEDGEELMDYLYNKGTYQSPKSYPKPDIILLDLNLPRKDGREALKEIKEDPELRKIPVITLTTSKTDEDILKTYDLGVNSFITKPVTFQNLVRVMENLTEYWAEIVELPSTDKHHEGKEKGL